MINFKINSVRHLETEQVWQDETTRYWFNVEFEDEGETREEEFAIAESGPDSKLLDSEGYPASDNWRYQTIKDALEKEIETKRLRD